MTDPEKNPWQLEVPADLVRAIDAYIDGDWSKQADPSRFGALNAVAYIGERIAAMRKATRETTP